MTALWHKGLGADEAMLRFTTRGDRELDQVLLPFDITASKAHVRGLSRVGALDRAESDALIEALDALAAEVDEGAFTIGREVEDGHTAIELRLSERLGEVGKKVHLGRSRNDQVLCAMRLYERAALAALAEQTIEIAQACLTHARAESRTLMPGYTHLQRAVPQTFGHWAACYADGFTDSARAILDARALLDGSPLGAAAGYGVNLPLDRDGVAHELGFLRPTINPLWSQTSRGTTEVVALSAVWHATAVARRLAWDLSLFTTAEFGFVKLPPELTTGSSIMPQKRNPDVIELVRASASVVGAAVVELMGLVALPSGYHRDLQLTKGAVIRALDEAHGALSALGQCVPRLELCRDRMAGAVTEDMLATDRAVVLARSGVPFRDAYRRVAADLDAGAADRPAGPRALESIEARSSLGAPGELALDVLADRLDRVADELSGPSHVPLPRRARP
jgi:argininosuccinate lyase